MIKIQVPDWNSSSIETVLDEQLFYIVMDWNSSGKYWTLAIRNSAYQTLIDGICVVPNYPLTWQFRYEGMPIGEIAVGSANFTSGPVPRDGFSSGHYAMGYYTEQDLMDMGWMRYYGRTTGSAV